MRNRLLLAAAALTLAACSESPAGVRQLKPSDSPSADITCRSGYFIATRDDGTQYCAKEGDTFTQTTAPKGAP